MRTAPGPPGCHPGRSGTPRAPGDRGQASALRGARRPDGSRVFVLCAVRHGDGITLASGETRVKANEIPEFQPLLDQIDDADLAGAVITADALLPSTPTPRTCANAAPTTS